MERCITLNENQDYLYYREGSGDTIEMWDLAVTSEKRKGNGRRLFQLLLERENPRFVFGFTRQSNINARNFYKALGFTETFIPKMYEDEGAYLIAYENTLYRKV